MPTPTYKAGTGYWTTGAVDPRTNTVGTGQWIEGGTPPATYSRLPEATPTPTVTPTPTPKFTPTPEVATPTPWNETTSRNNAIAQRESQFSAIRELYDSRKRKMIEDETKLGNRDLARANTISAMTGMAGGVDATSRAGVTEKATDKIIRDKSDMIDAEKAAAIAGIYDKIDANVQREKELAITADREERSRKLDEMSRSASANILSFATQGIEWDKAWSDPYFQAEVKRTGKDPMTLKKEYEVNRAAKNVQQTNFSTKIEGGKIISSWVDYDPKTGKYTPKFESHDIPGGGSYTHSHYDTNSGKLVVWDDAGNSKIMPLSAGGGGGTPTSEQKNQENDALNWLRLQPTYSTTDAEKFKTDEVFRAWAIDQAKQKAILDKIKAGI